MNVYIVIGGDNRDTVSLLSEQLPFAPFIIGVDGGCLKLMEASLPIHLAVGDFDSVSKADKDKILSVADQHITLHTEKDQTDFEVALTYVIEHLTYESITVLGAFGGRLDHELSCLWIAYHPAFQSALSDICFLNRNNSIRFLKPGHHRIDKLNQMKYLSFISLTEIEELTLKYVVYPLTNHYVPHPIAYISNEFLTDQMEIIFTNGLIMVLQTNDRK